MVPTPEPNTNNDDDDESGHRDLEQGEPPVSTNQFVSTPANTHTEDTEKSTTAATASTTKSTTTSAPDDSAESHEISKQNEIVIGAEPPRHATGEVIDAKNTAGDTPSSSSRPSSDNRAAVKDTHGRKSPPSPLDKNLLDAQRLAHVSNHPYSDSTTAESATSASTLLNKSSNPPRDTTLHQTPSARLPLPNATTDGVSVDADLWNTSVQTVRAYPVTQPASPLDPTLQPQPTDTTSTAPEETSDAARVKPPIHRCFWGLVLLALALIGGVSVAFVCGTGGCASSRSNNDEPNTSAAPQGVVAGPAATAAPTKASPPNATSTAPAASSAETIVTNVPTTISPTVSPNAPVSNTTTTIPGTSRPTLSPTTLVPTNSTLSPTTATQASIREEAVVAFINNVTLSGRFIAGPSENNNSGYVMEQALQWLILEDPMQLSPDTPANQFRLKQRYALRTLFVQEKRTDPWTRRSGWATSDADECGWYGINCTAVELDNGVGVQMAVTELYMSKNNMYGILPVDLGLLSSLRGCEVLENNFVGKFPSTLGHWTALEYIVAYDNALTGPLPTEFSKWTALTAFSVSGNELNGTIPQLFRTAWTNFEAGFFYNNSFTGTVPFGSCNGNPESDTLTLVADCLSEVTCGCCDRCE